MLVVILSWTISFLRANAYLMQKRLPLLVTKRMIPLVRVVSVGVLDPLNIALNQCSKHVSNSMAVMFYVSLVSNTSYFSEIMPSLVGVQSTSTCTTRRRKGSLAHWHRLYETIISDLSNVTCTDWWSWWAVTGCCFLQTVLPSGIHPIPHVLAASFGLHLESLDFITSTQRFLGTVSLGDWC